MLLHLVWECIKCQIFMQGFFKKKIKYKCNLNCIASFLALPPFTSGSYPKNSRNIVYYLLITVFQWLTHKWCCLCISMFDMFPLRNNCRTMPAQHPFPRAHLKAVGGFSSSTVSCELAIVQECHLLCVNLLSSFAFYIKKWLENSFEARYYNLFMAYGSEW